MAQTSVVHDYLAGAIGGCAGVAVGHPFETVKVQLQTRGGQDRYKSILDCLRSVQAQGLSRGYFRGLSWPLLSYGAINSVYFGVYGTALTHLGVEEGSTVRDGRYYMTVFAAGCIGGVAQAPLATPVESIKVLLQSEIPHLHGKKSAAPISKNKFHKGPLAAASDVLKTRGVQGLYRGFGTQICRDIPASGIYILFYEFFTHNVCKSFPSVPSQVVNFLGGGLAGVFSWMAILPFDVMKSRLQSDPNKKMYKGLWDCMLKSYRSEGISIFFRGCVVMSVRAFPVNAVTLMVYSECLVAFKQLQTA